MKVPLLSNKTSFCVVIIWLVVNLGKVRQSFANMA